MVLHLLIIPTFLFMTVISVLFWERSVLMRCDGLLWRLTLLLKFGKLLRFDFDVKVCTVLTGELRETNDKSNRYYARVLYSGWVLKTIHGTLDWVPLADLIDIMSPYVPEDIV